MWGKCTEQIAHPIKQDNNLCMKFIRYMLLEQKSLLENKWNLIWNSAPSPHLVPLHPSKPISKPHIVPQNTEVLWNWGDVLRRLVCATCLDAIIQFQVFWKLVWGLMYCIWYVNTGKILHWGRIVVSFFLCGSICWI